MASSVRAAIQIAVLIDAIGLDAAEQPWRQFEVILLDPHGSGIKQLTQALRGKQDVFAIHILSHGSAGILQLGDQQFDGRELESQAQEIASWRGALREGADILLYGCVGGTANVELAYNDGTKAHALRVTAAESLWGFGQVAPHEWNLDVAATGGTLQFTVDDGTGITQNTAIVKVSDARLDSVFIQNAIQQALGQLGVSAATVSVYGAGTPTSPWEIILKNAGNAKFTAFIPANLTRPAANPQNLNPAPQPVAATGFTFKNSTAGVAPVLKRWQLFTRNATNQASFPAAGGAFKLVRWYGG